MLRDWRLLGSRLQWEVHLSRVDEVFLRDIGFILVAGVVLLMRLVCRKLLAIVAIHTVRQCRFRQLNLRVSLVL